MARHQHNQGQDRQGRDRAQGFTLVEVLVGILLISAFLGTAMQAIVSATAFKVKAQELSEATVWIQEDQELVRYQASRIAADVPRCSALSPSTGYAQALEEQLSSIPTKYSALGKRPYTIARISTPVNVQPYHVLSLNYAVTRQGESAPIAQIHSEVIPDAFLSCP
jgi:prepilin-type N-terminal cleavage/methylation domain-containing protein